MNKSKIITGFTKLSDSELDVKSQEIITKMTGNTNFTSPTPTLVELTTAEREFATSLTNAAHGNTNDTAIKNQKRKELESELHRLGLYVELTANGSEDVLFSSGFELQKGKSLVGVLPKPENLKVNIGVNPGSVKINVNSIANADSYLFEYTEAPAIDSSVWVIISSSKANVEITGLTSGKQYAFKVAGVGASTTQVFSDIVTSFIL
jgi:hypothetical protein